LSKASPVFKDMFTFPHPPCPSPFVKSSDDNKDGLPLVRLPESSATLDAFISHLSHRVPQHAVAKFTEPAAAASAAEKRRGRRIARHADRRLAVDNYEVSSLREMLTSRLQSQPLMTRQPLCLFGIAYYLRSQAVLKTAATHTLTLAPSTLDSLGRHVDLAPFIVVRHLVEYHRACDLTAREFVLRRADEDEFAEVFFPGWFACLPTGTGERGHVCREKRRQFGNLRSRFRLKMLEWWRTLHAFVWRSSR
jgi:hypothetical protein